MEYLKNCLLQWNIDFDQTVFDRLEKYYDLLVSWNEKINLTSIVQKDEVYIKHFADSISVLNYIDLSGKTVLDVGTGAGFPGIVLKIFCPDCNIILLDSLNKRVGFLNTVIDELDLSDISAIHSRAEDLASDKSHREKYDVVVSRAVANLSTLSEYCLPFVNINGLFISYKSGNIDDELSASGNAVKTLGGKIERVEKFSLPDTDIDRSFVFIKKSDHTKKRFPRKAGTPSKDPL